MGSPEVVQAEVAFEGGLAVEPESGEAAAVDSVVDLVFATEWVDQQIAG